MGIRPEEFESAERFKDFLSESGRESKWYPVPSDPPDLCFEVGPERWAVEVTGLFQYVEWNGSEKNIRNIEAPLEALCRRLEKLLPSKANLDYMLFVSAPFSPDWHELERRAREYIKRGETKPEYLDAEEVLSAFEDMLRPGSTDPAVQTVLESALNSMLAAQGRVRICTQPGSGRVDWAAMLEGTATIPGPDVPGRDKPTIADIRATLDYSVQRILDKKLPRLRKVSGYDRKMILIWTDYLFADIDRISEVLSSRKLASEDVDSIVLIGPDSRLGCVADPGGLFRLSRRQA